MHHHLFVFSDHLTQTSLHTLYILRHANGADDHQLSTPEELLGNIDAPKDTSGDGEDAAQQMPMDSVGAFDVPVAETVKKRRSNKPCDDDTTSLMKTPTKMILRKKATSDACSSAPLSTRSKNQGLTSSSTKRKRKSSPSPCARRDGDNESSAFPTNVNVLVPLTNSSLINSPSNTKSKSKGKGKLKKAED